MKHIFLFLFLIILTACAGPQSQNTSEALTLTAVDFKNLPEWTREDFRDFSQAFEQSCNTIRKKPADQAVGKLAEAGTYGDWQAICRDAETATDMRAFIEQRFQPYAVMDGRNQTGLFTGYYEASLKGSRTKTATYNTPLHKRPADLVMVQLGDFRESLKGQRIAGRVKNGTLTPMPPRAELVKNNNPDDVLVWVDDPIDAFFVQIQGSGVVELTDGSTMRIGYAGQNGHPYYAIGRELVKRGHMETGDVSMQSIRQWLDNNPDQADAVLNTNASYVFFRNTGKTAAIGAQGVPLTPLRSLAVDHTLIPYGVPLWVSLDKPDLNRLMIAQDTGGAIRGPVRGDVFWGYGDDAETNAGAMNTQGQYWVLLPR